MAVSTTLQNGSSVIAWQSGDGVDFQLLDSNGVPLGDPQTAMNGAGVWTSIAPSADGGFSIVWDSGINAAPMAQDYSAGGVALGAPHILSAAPPTAPLASTSLEPTSGGDFGPWSARLSNGDTVVATSASQAGPELLIQQYDPAGRPVGPQYADMQQGLPGLGNVQTMALANGAYVVTFTDNSNYSASLDYDLFRADGTHLAARTVATANYQLFPAHEVASLADGGFVMSWVAASSNAAPFTPAPYGVFAEEFSADGSAATAPQLLGTLPMIDGTPETTMPEITAFADGKYTISWTSGGAMHSAGFTEQGSPAASYDNDTIFTPAAQYTLPVGPHNVTLVGSAAQSVTGNDLGDRIVSNNAASTLIGGQGADTLVAGHNANVMTGGAGADTFVYPALPWNAGHITDFNPAQDKIDVSAILKSVGYGGGDPFGDGTLTLKPDGHGGSDLMYNPPGAGTNGHWPITIVDIDHVASLNTATDFITTPGGGGDTSSGGDSGAGTGSGTTSGATTGGGTTGGGTTGGGTTGGSTTGSDTGGDAGTGTGPTLTGNDTAGQLLTATAPDATFIAGHNSVVMTEDGGNNIFEFNVLPWNAGQITNFNPAMDKIDVSAILANVGYAGSNPFADGTLSLKSDGHGGSDLMYNPPGAGTNGHWPITIGDIDHVTASQFQAGDWVFHH